MARKLTKAQKRSHNRAKFRAKSKGRGRKHSHHTKRGRKGRRNPGMERTLHDGTTLQLHQAGRDGVIYVHHPDGSMTDVRKAWDKAVAYFKKFTSGKTYRKRASQSAWAELAMDNPRRRKGRGRKTRRNCEDPRYATTRIIRKPGKSRRNCGMGMRRNVAQFPAPYAMPFQSGLNPRRGRKGRGRKSRRNPAQFPMPFVSAMNPYRTRRNFPINRKQARTMGKVLRQHGYKRCKV